MYCFLQSPKKKNFLYLSINFPTCWSKMETMRQSGMTLCLGFVRVLFCIPGRLLLLHIPFQANIPPIFLGFSSGAASSGMRNYGATI